MLKRMFLLVLISGAAGISLRAQNYKTALGLRLSSNDALVNNAVSIKHFVNPVVAFEGLLSFKPAAVGVLAEVHHPVSAAPGLRWLFGGGAFVYFDKGAGGGLQGILGLDYKFVNVPLNLSVDWKPEFEFSHGLLFEPAVVGFTARFTLPDKNSKKN
jgi:hypothetical protein